MSDSCFGRVAAAARGTALAFMVVALATSAPGQTGTPTCVPGTNPLQAAVNAAQPGDAIDVGANPNLGQRVCVTKPLLFFSTGTPPATVTATSGAFPPFYTPMGVFQIDPGVSGVVAFHNLQISGVTCFATTDAVMRGIYSESPNVTLIVDGCVVAGADYGCGVGDNSENGAAGIEGTVARLVVKDSTVTGGDGDIAGWSYDPGPNPNIFCLDTASAGIGGVAIDVTGEVLLVRGVLAGGDGGDAVGNTSICACASPPPSYADAGSGGSAVVAPTVWSWGSTGTAGAGGVVRCVNTVYSQAPAGAPLPPGGISTLQVGPQPSLGGTALFNLQNPGGQFAAIAVGTTGFGPAVPVSGTDPYFLGPSPIVVAAALGLTGLAIPVLNDPALVGLALPVQAGIQTPGGFALTNPDVVLILP
ncbi:MAG: hypothetical protein L0323_13180 [Planctomycetes bacterium]|nr:hypothetical protein [Planctomycetota bacterium]